MIINNYISLLTTIMNYGKVVSPRGKEIKELMHVKLNIAPECNVYSFPEVRDINLLTNYANKELPWYYSGIRDADYIKNEAKIWKKIVNPDNSLNSNYGYLVYYHQTIHPSLGNITKTPFHWALYSLIEDKDTRQAIMTYNNGGYNYVGNNDYICTQHQAFFIRDNILKCFIALRSSDSIYGLPYNMMWWSLVHQDLYLQLLPTYPDLKRGDIEVDIYSSHIYQPHYELVDKMLEGKNKRHFLELNRPMEIGHSLSYYLENLKTYLTLKDL